ncbi:hypothetical protein Hanom_Chr16g01493521 [Helianthus anomalus]
MFRVCFDHVPVGDLTHDDRVEIANIEYRHNGNADFGWVKSFLIFGGHTPRRLDHTASMPHFLFVGLIEPNPIPTPWPNKRAVTT